VCTDSHHPSHHTNKQNGQRVNPMTQNPNANANKRANALAAQLLELAHDAVSDARRALGVQAVHHRFDKIQFVLNGKVDEIRVCRGVCTTRKKTVCVCEMLLVRTFAHARHGTVDTQ
jgi:hypothetical protein